MKLIYPLALAFALPCAALAGEPGEATPAASPYRFADKESLDRRLDDVRRDVGAAALVAAFSKDGELVYEGAFGQANRVEGIPAQMDTVFAMASVTKPLTATAIMMLVDDGKVDLDAPVNRYIADHPVRGINGSADDVTVERVMRHTAGLPLVYDLVHEDDGAKPRSFSEMMAAHGYTVFPPGDRSEYSNLGYEILAEIIRRQSGMEYGEFLEHRLFEPVGMDSAFIASGFERPVQVAVPYMANGAVAPAVDTGHPGAAMAYMSVRDMIRFGEFITSAWHGETNLLSQDSARKMTSPTEGESPWAGLGFFFWDFKGWSGIGHGGSMAGVKTRINLFPEQRMVMALASNHKHYSIENYTIEELMRSFAPDHMTMWTLATVPEKLAGTRWTGMIGATDTRARIEVDLTDPQLPIVRIDGKDIAVRSMDLNSRWTFRLDGELDAPELDFEHTLRFNLLERDDSYIGEVRAEQRTGVYRDHGGVGYWVKLTPAD